MKILIIKIKQILQCCRLPWSFFTTTKAYHHAVTSHLGSSSHLLDTLVDHFGLEASTGGTDGGVRFTSSVNKSDTSGVLDSGLPAKSSSQSGIKGLTESAFDGGSGSGWDLLINAGITNI